ncbi:hypothetical protein B0H11DRAFT_2241695 [Mycena galericulata]|nr:hypothetical protein B0H11DRAFT_2241695 [Mycena galericulata]
MHSLNVIVDLTVDQHGILACELWPEDFRFTHALLVPMDEAMMPPWQIVPRDVAEFSEWSYIYHHRAARERSRAKILVYRSPSNPVAGAIHPVQIRAQGFIKKCVLQPLGTWDGTPDRVSAAVQTITMCNGEGGDEAWVATIQAIDNVKAYVYRTLGATHPAPGVIPAIERHLFLQRRVFTKVRNAESDVSVLRDGDDPYAFCEGIHKDWRVTKYLSTGRVIGGVDEGANIVPCDHTAFREGDFVDVGISIDVAAVPQRRGAPRVDIHLFFEHVLQLRAADIELGEDATLPHVTVVQQELTFNVA